MSKRIESCTSPTLRAHRTEALKFARIYDERSQAGRYFLNIARACEEELDRRAAIRSAMDERSCKP